MLIFRNASQTDIPLIRMMVEEIWPLAYGAILEPDQIAYMIGRMYDPAVLAQQMSIGLPYIMASVQGKEIGFAAYTSMSETGFYHLDKLYLLPETQGKGFGKKLLEEVIRRVQAAGGNHLLLHVNRYNRAKDFYKKLGFEIIRSEDNDIGKGYFMNDYVMQLDL